MRRIAPGSSSSTGTGTPPQPQLLPVPPALRQAVAGLLAVTALSVLPLAWLCAAWLAVKKGSQVQETLATLSMSALLFWPVGKEMRGPLF